MKFFIALASVAALGVLASPAEAAHRHVVHLHHHYHHYAYRHRHYAYGGPYGYPPPYYYAPPAPFYGYANPPVYNEGPQYGPYPWSWGYRNTLNLLLNLEGDRPFTD